MKISLVLGFLLSASILLAQKPISILFVKDGLNESGNSFAMQKAMDSLSIQYSTFDTKIAGKSPSFLYMQNFQLVIWYSSGIERNYVWNIGGSDNTGLTTYLDNGGNLWLIGNDFLAERFGNFSQQFRPEEFPNKYLGISTYKCHAVAEISHEAECNLFPSEYCPISDLKSLSLAKMISNKVNVLTCNDLSVPVYQDHSACQTQRSKSCEAILCQNGASQVLTYAFDLNQQIDFEGIKSNISLVLSYFTQSALEDQFDPKFYKVVAYPGY
ncbi:MAG: hypothetical protein ABIV51_02320 [Saprospiraceae bacterium]